MVEHGVTAGGAQSASTLARRVPASPARHGSPGSALCRTGCRSCSPLASTTAAYSLPSRNFWAIAVWWAVILVVALGGSESRAIGWSGARRRRIVVGVRTRDTPLCLPGATAPSAQSTSSTACRSMSASSSSSCSSRRELSRARWCDGLAIGICGVVAVALISRFAPDTFSDRGAAEVLPGAVVRLSFPLGYWNGLAILAALAVPLLLRSASRRVGQSCVPRPLLLSRQSRRDVLGVVARRVRDRADRRDRLPAAQPRALVAAGSDRGGRARLSRLGCRGRSAVGVREHRRHPLQVATRPAPHCSGWSRAAWRLA